jgi:anti-anti-sigma factor
MQDMPDIAAASGHERRHRIKVDEQLTISVDRVAGVVVVTLTGEMDLAVEERIRGAVATAISSVGVGAMRVDANAIRFLDASGVRSLLLARQTAEDHGLSFTLGISSPGPGCRILALCGLTEWFADSHSATDVA